MALGPSLKVVLEVIAYVLVTPRRRTVIDELVMAMTTPLTLFAGALVVTPPFVTIRSLGHARYIVAASSAPTRSGAVDGDEVGTAAFASVL
jgi:hypothetical protein